MNEHTSIVEKEYMMLREEIMYHQKQRDSIAQFCYTVCVAAIAAAFASKVSWINLCVLLFLVPMSLKAAESSNSIAFLASYMKAYLERDFDIKWETHHHNYYLKYKRKGTLWVIHYCARWDFLCLSIVSSFLFWLMRNFDLCVRGHIAFGWIIIVLQVLVIIFEGYIGFVYSNFVKLKDDMLDNWNKLLKDKTHIEV